MENVSKLESLDTNTLKLILKNALDDKREKIQGDFLTFVKTVWPEFIEGKHHKIYAEKLNRIANISGRLAIDHFWLRGRHFNRAVREAWGGLCRV